MIDHHTLLVSALFDPSHGRAAHSVLAAACSPFVNDYVTWTYRIGRGKFIFAHDPDTLIMSPRTKIRKHFII